MRRTSSSSGRVRNVTTTHTRVEMPTVESMIHAHWVGSSASQPTPNQRTTLATSDATMALISDHALMRHQYQRRMSTSPVPAPRARRKRHAPSMLVRKKVTPSDASMRRMVAHRDTLTRERWSASGFQKRAYRSFTR